MRARLQRFQDEQKAINYQIRILKGRYSNQIYQIRESIMNFLDKETGTLGERIRTLFKEQGITIISILTALGMTLGVLIEALLGGPSASTPTSGGTSGGDRKGGAREWIKNKLKALSQLLGKLADKALASLPGIISSILSWILNRANEVIGWLSQNLWALITGVGVLCISLIAGCRSGSRHSIIFSTAFRSNAARAPDIPLGPKVWNHCISAQTLLGLQPVHIIVLRYGTNAFPLKHCSGSHWSIIFSIAFPLKRCLGSKKVHLITAQSPLGLQTFY